jgi:hypothetical protein
MVARRQASAPGGRSAAGAQRRPYGPDRRHRRRAGRRSLGLEAQPPPSKGDAADRGSRKQPILCYADVALLASILRDDLVATSLHKLYLEPLERARDGGKVARETLRAYFAAERNISSTAAALGVDRRTVRNRIRAIEELLGRPLKGSVAELEIALRFFD